MPPEKTTERGGWVEAGPARRHQPKATLFRTLAVLWIFPSLGAALIVVWNSPRLREATSLGDALGRVAFEQWIALAVLVAHGMFGWLAWRYGRHEPWREAPVLVPNPNVDPTSSIDAGP